MYDSVVLMIICVETVIILTLLLSFLFFFLELAKRQNIVPNSAQLGLLYFWTLLYESIGKVIIVIGQIHSVQEKQSYDDAAAVSSAVVLFDGEGHTTPNFDSNRLSLSLV